MKDATALSHEAQTTTSFYPHADPINAGACWYLVDQAKHPDVLRLLFEHDPAPVYDLPYIHSQYREQAFDGPLIIKPTTSQSEKWLHNLLAEAKTLSHHQRLRVLGPLTAIHGCYAGTNWSLKKDHSPAHPTEAKEQNPLPLEVTQENLAFVEVYRRDLLAKGLADNNKLAAQTVSCWFQQLTTLGASSEQGLVEGAGLLIAQGFTRALSEAELATVSRTRQRAYWSDTLDALATLTHSQDGT